MSNASDSAAWRFLEAIRERPFPPEAIECAKAAFHLYEREWDCHAHHIGGWQWPKDEVARGGTFEGGEPWTILLRHAYNLTSRPQAQEATP